MKSINVIAIVGTIAAFSACSGNGSASSQNPGENQEQGPNPEIVEFKLDKPRVKAQTTVRMTWQSKNAETCLLKDSRNQVLADRAQGNFERVITQTEPFTLWCHNGTKSVEKTVEAVAETESGLRIVNQDLKGEKNLWNLDYIDGKLDGKYTTVGSGKGVRLYVIDDGIFGGHPEFEDRVKEGTNLLGEYVENTGNKGYPLKGWVDKFDKLNLLDDHGTHVAGIAAGRTFGVAKDLEIIPVRVRSGWFGDESERDVLLDNKVLLEGLKFVLENERKQSGGRAIVNLSTLFHRYMIVEDSEDRIQSLETYTFTNGTMEGFKGEFDDQIREAIKSLVDSNIVVFTAAGNGGCGVGRNGFRFTEQYTPQVFAREIPGVVNVGNLAIKSNEVYANSTDAWPEFWVPGSDVVSTVGTIDDKGTKYYTKVYSGTSMASPLLAGMAAIMMERNPLLTARAIEEELTGVSDVRTDLKHLYFGNEGQSSHCVDLSRFPVALTTLPN